MSEKTGWKEKDDRTIVEIRDYLEREGLDVFIPSKVANIAYLTNYYDWAHMNLTWEEVLAVLVIPREDDAFIVGISAHFAGAPDYGVAPWWLAERYPVYVTGKEILDETIALIKRKGLDRGRIGIEKKWMPVAIHEYLRQALPQAEFVSADLLVPRMRFIKIGRELALMRKACEAGLRSMEAYMQAVRAGASRAEASLLRAQRCLEYGAEWWGGLCGTTWTGAMDVHPAWWDSDARQRFHDAHQKRNWMGLPDDAPMLITHFETRFQYYVADMAWHEFYGPEPAENEVIDFGNQKVSYAKARRDFEVVQRVQSDALQVIRPGMDQVQAKQAVDEYLRSDREATEHISCYFIHSIGLEVHEEPTVSSLLPRLSYDRPFYYQPGAVVASEWFTGLWTVEDPFLMTESGWKPLAGLKGIIDPAAGLVP